MIFLPYILHFYIISSNSLYIHTHKHIHIYTGGVNTANSSVWENNGRRFLTSSLSIIASQRREFYCWSSDFTKKNITYFCKTKIQAYAGNSSKCRTKMRRKFNRKKNQVAKMYLNAQTDLQQHLTTSTTTNKEKFLECVLSVCVQSA